jgi:uncharacterized membrane protein YgcG
MKRINSFWVPCLALGAAMAYAGGCAGSGSGNAFPGGGNGDDGGGGNGDGGGDTTPHALGVILLGEAHAPSGGTAKAVVSASFLPDASSLNTCSTTVHGCDFVSAPKCGTTGNTCGADEACTWDPQCHASCQKVCVAKCAADEECYFAGADQPACRKREVFDAGALAFAGTTTPITLFPPYAYTPTGDGAPFLAGAQIEVQASGATGAGFDKFDEKFTATTFLQTDPPIDKIALTSVFGSDSVPISWAAGQDTIEVTVSGAGGVATCQADDTSGHFDLPRDVVQAAAGMSSFLTLSISRQRTDTRKNETTHGTLLTSKVQPVGWLSLTTASTESATFMGCPNPNETLCADGCYDTTYDRQHCGSCTNACNVDQACQSGSCTGGSSSGSSSGGSGSGSGSGSSSGGSSSGSGSSGSSSGGQTCTQCETQAESGTCSSQYTTCANDADCPAFQTCVQGCNMDATCISNCETSHPNGYNEYLAFANCICGSACSGPCAMACGM